MLKIHSGRRPSQKRHVMDWFLQLFSYIRLHKLGMGLWNQVPLCCWIRISKTSLVDIQLARAPTGLSCSSTHLSRLGFWAVPWQSLRLACWHLTSLARSCFREHKARLVCLSTPTVARASQSVQSLACCSQGTAVHIPPLCDHCTFHCFHRIINNWTFIKSS